MTKIQCILTILSPLHLGSAAAEINNTEFFYDNKYLYQVSEKGIAEALKEEGQIEDFINYMAGGRASLQEYLDTPPYIAKEALIERLVCRRVALSGPAEGRINSVRPFQQDMLTGKPYIPGSSIKGALRSNILFGLMDKKMLGVEQVAGIIQTGRRNDRQKIGTIVNRLLESADLAYTRPGPHRDWLRALKVSDAFSQDNRPSRIREVKVASLNKDGCGFHWGAGKASIHVETLDVGTKFAFTLEIDEQLLKIMQRARKPPFDLQDMCMFNNAPKPEYIIAAERDFWKRAGLASISDRQERYIAGGANLRLGWGSGYLGTTIGAYLSDQLRLDIGRKFYNTRYNTFPNSRKVVVENNMPADALGWCKLERV